eukprot:s520_g39.t1
MGIWKIKLTGKIPALKKGVLQFLGRTIYRERDGESSLSLGVSEAYMVGIMDSWHEKLKPTEVPPKLEDLVKSKEKESDVALTQEGEARYRRVLGQLAWAALSRADLCFYVSFLARFQSKPTASSEACVLCCAALAADASASRAGYAITGGTSTWRTMRAHRVLRCVMECGISIGRRVGVSRVLRESVFA